MSAFLVIMAGGSGTRFWPKSTSKRPKQLLKFGGNESLLIQTLNRFPWIPETHCLIVTTEKLKAEVEKEVKGRAQVLAEPEGKNTAPCIFWAAKEIEKIDPKAVMCVMPADHYIANLPAYQETVQRAVDWAKEHDDLVTLGVSPTRPETGYGYLEQGRSLGEEGAFEVAQFIEKPNLNRAHELIQSGKCLWNGGMFLWRAEVILEAFQKTMPELEEIWTKNSGEVKKAYPLFPSESVDFGVMEKSSNVVTFPLDCGWDDLGSWVSLENLGDTLGIKKEVGVVSDGEALGIDSKGNVIDVPQKLVSLIGVEDLIIVENEGALLVAQKSRAQEIKKVVEILKQSHPKSV